MADNPDIDLLIEQARLAAYRWDSESRLGEIVLVIGANDRQLEEREIIKHPRIRRGRRGESTIGRMTD